VLLVGFDYKPLAALARALTSVIGSQLQRKLVKETPASQTIMLRSRGGLRKPLSAPRTPSGHSDALNHFRSFSLAVCGALLPLQNALNFPVARLQPPVFDPQAQAAVNYGAMGKIIGHEISHTFDTEGSAFDSKGRARNWWKPADRAHFNAATARLAAQYDTTNPSLTLP
jgi:hypothetical protein